MFYDFWGVGGLRGTCGRSEGFGASASPRPTKFHPQQGITPKNRRTLEHSISLFIYLYRYILKKNHFYLPSSTSIFFVCSISQVKIEHVLEHVEQASTAPLPKKLAQVLDSYVKLCYNGVWSENNPSTTLSSVPRPRGIHPNPLQQRRES